MKGIMDKVRSAGLKGCLKKLCNRAEEMLDEDTRYGLWIKRNEKDMYKTEALKYKPLISVVGCDIKEQTVSNYEVVNDIDLAKGEYIAIVNRGDNISPNCIYEITKKLNEKKYDMIYSDEDRLLNGKRCQPFFKPDWSPETFKSYWYMGGISVYRRDIFPKGEYNYESVKTAVEKCSDIGHIDKVLYHRQGDFVYYNGDITKLRDKPKISVIIPSKDNYEVLYRCIKSLKDITEYNNYEIILVDNGSGEDNREKYGSLCADVGAEYIYCPMEFNFAKMCNMGADKASGELILLLNDDIEVISSDWLEKMAAQAMEEGIGAVGAKLLYPGSDIIQHCGVVMFPVGPVHILAGLSDSKMWYYGRNRYRYNYMAVTAACLMVKRDKYKACGGMCEELAVGYNDVALCAELCRQGYRNVLCNDVALYHHESVSRGNDLADKRKSERLDREREILYGKYPECKGEDPYYSKGLSKRRIDFTVR